MPARHRRRRRRQSLGSPTQRPLRPPRGPLNTRAAGIPFEEVRINVMKGEQRTPTYLAINPLGKVPAMQVCVWWVAGGLVGGRCHPASDQPAYPAVAASWHCMHMLPFLLLQHPTAS